MSSREKIRDIEKARSIFAYEKVEKAINELEPKDRKEYKAYCKKIPSLIQTNGLSATFAFMFSKRTGTYMFIYNQVDEWLKKQYTNDNNINNDTKLMERLVRLDSTKYRKVTIEVLALFSWLRRFAEGRISRDG